MNGGSVVSLIFLTTVLAFAVREYSGNHLPRWPLWRSAALAVIWIAIFAIIAVVAGRFAR